MRRRLMIGQVFTASCILAGSLEAAVIKGRVVDSSGQPVGSAEIRIWRKTKAPDGMGRNEPVKFDGAETLRTDGSGRFATEDIFDATVPARVVAQADGMLAGRSGWVLPEQQVASIDDIILRRLRSVRGQVLDRQGTPVAGATVFNSGDAHTRIETKADETGQFTLDGVPEAAVFLFAEKPGFRFGGIICQGGTDEQITLTRNRENAEPLTLGGAAVSDAESAELGRKLLEPYLQAVLERGSQAERFHCHDALRQIDPQRALALAAAVAGEDSSQIDNARCSAILAWVGSKTVDDWDEITALIQSFDDPWFAQRLYVAAADAIDDSQRGRKLEWLAQALVHARRIDDPVDRAFSLAWIANRLLGINETSRARKVLDEAIQNAVRLPPENFAAMLAFERIAVVLCKTDSSSSISWLDRIGHLGRYGYACGAVAVELATAKPSEADMVWRRPEARNDARASLGRANLLPDFFYRMARSDRQRAEGLASIIRDTEWRVRAWGAISRGVAQTNGAEGRALLMKALGQAEESLSIRGELSDLGVTRAGSVAWLIPIAQHVAPDVTEEIVWRAASLRELRPATENLDDEVEQADAALAKLLAPFNREVARALVSPLVPRLATFTHPTSNGQQLWELLTAAALIDPRWAVELFHSLAQPADLASRRPQNHTRMWLARFLAYPYKRRLEFLNYFDPE